MRPKDGFLSLCVCMYVYVCESGGLRSRSQYKAVLGVAPRCPRGSSPLVLIHTTFHSFIHSFFLLLLFASVKGDLYRWLFTWKLDYEAKWRPLYDIINSFSSWWRMRIFKLTVPTIGCFDVGFRRNAEQSFTHRFRSSMVQVQRNVYEWVFNDGSS